MKISYHQKKYDWTLKERNISFDDAIFLDWDNALIFEDIRKDYGEKRYTAIGKIDEKYYAVCFTPREDCLHVFSMRRANKRERKRYDRGY